MQQEEEGRQETIKNQNNTQESYLLLLLLLPMKPNPKKEHGIDEQKNRWMCPEEDPISLQQFD